MGRLVAIEGLDGSGKRTLANRLVADLRARGARVASMAFPRYGASVHADLVRDALYGRVGDLADSVYGCAVLFALDRQDAAADLRRLVTEHDIVLLDRYVSSNAAYGSARLGSGASFPDWIRQLEIERLGIPAPDLQLLLAAPVELARQRTRDRAGTDVDRALDRFEADAGLQERTAAKYAELARSGYLSPWQRIAPGVDVTELLR